MARIPVRWKLAGLVRRFMPDVRGRDRILSLLTRDIPPPSGLTTGQFGPGLRYEFDLTTDTELPNLFFLQYEKPSLAPILEATLRPGDRMYDIGANIGIYSLWGSRLVGEGGRVFSFEPVPNTRAMLERLIDQNGCSNIVVIPNAVGAAAGQIRLQVLPGISGLSSATRPLEGATDIEVESISIDDFIRDNPSPTVVKIDVEGFELEVLRGMQATIEEHRPLVISEMIPTEGSSERPVKELLDIAGEHGYEVFNLDRRGLTNLTTELTPTTNVLLAHPEQHEDELRRLSALKYRRNQTL
ncbi:MAG: hypothetical protein QOG54_2208 [Actinomycetota bacterium]|jgi:FkbM family methyltransferase|nr:hypothetical protein [Actinomycetota bacterium]